MPVALCWLLLTVFLYQDWAGVDSQYWPLLKPAGFQMLKPLYNGLDSNGA